MRTLELIEIDGEEEPIATEDVSDAEAGRRLCAYRLRADLLTRDSDAVYVGRFVQESAE